MYYVKFISKQPEKKCIFHKGFSRMYILISIYVLTISICITDKKMPFQSNHYIYILFNMNIKREHRVKESFSIGKLLYQHDFPQKKI